MIGTNDAERSSVEVYERELREIIRRVEARSVVLALSTIPEQQSSDDARRLGAALNDVIRRVAHELHLPLVDYHGALEGLSNNGLDPDNVHPSIFMAGGTNASAGALTEEGLRYGYNVRNLTSLFMLERLMQAVGLRE
jgi:lysophospholipase L1-like esterase